MSKLVLVIAYLLWIGGGLGYLACKRSLPTITGIFLIMNSVGIFLLGLAVAYAIPIDWLKPPILLLIMTGTLFFQAKALGKGWFDIGTAQARKNWALSDRREV